MTRQNMCRVSSRHWLIPPHFEPIKGRAWEARAPGIYADPSITVTVSGHLLLNCFHLSENSWGQVWPEASRAGYINEFTRSHSYRASWKWSISGRARAQAGLLHVRARVRTAQRITRGRARAASCCSWDGDDDGTGLITVISPSGPHPGTGHSHYEGFTRIPPSLTRLHPHQCSG